MSSYNVTSIFSTALFIYAVFLLFRTYFGKTMYHPLIEKLSYLGAFLLSSFFRMICSVPILKMVFFLALFFLISLNYKSSTQKKLTLVCLIYSIILVFELTIAAFFGFSMSMIYYPNEFESIIGLFLIDSMDVLVAYLISNYHRLESKNYKISKIYYFAFTIILFGTLYLFISSLGKQNLKFYNILFNGGILILVNSTIIVIDRKIYDSIHMANEKTILKQQNIAYENQYKIMKESAQTIKSLKHDMKNHLIVLEELYKTGKTAEIESYIGQLLETIDGEAFANSNNFVIDSIINLKLQKFTHSNADISVEIAIPSELPISNYDLTTILGNLLDNAITAMEQSTTPLLKLNILYNMGNLIILIDNSYNNIVPEENGSFKTTKSNKEIHGIGISSIQKTLEKYQGEMQMEYDQQLFSTSVIIPCE